MAFNDMESLINEVFDLLVERLNERRNNPITDKQKRIDMQKEVFEKFDAMITGFRELGDTLNLSLELQNKVQQIYTMHALFKLFEE